MTVHSGGDVSGSRRDESGSGLPGIVLPSQSDPVVAGLSQAIGGPVGVHAGGGPKPCNV